MSLFLLFVNTLLKMPLVIRYWRITGTNNNESVPVIRQYLITNGIFNSDILDRINLARLIEGLPQRKRKRNLSEQLKNAQSEVRQEFRNRRYRYVNRRHDENREGRHAEEYLCDKAEELRRRHDNGPIFTIYGNIGPLSCLLRNSSALKAW